MIGAGDLRDRIKFERRGLDSNGDALGPWEEAFSVAAQIIWLRGSEGALQMRMEGKQPVVMVVRSSAMTRDIKTSWRAENARDASQKFNITAVSPSKQSGFIDVLATMGGATG